MTASLPVPQDAASAPDDGVSVEAAGSRIVPLSDASGKPAARTPKRRPARSPKPVVDPDPVGDRGAGADPGPPPPLPPDLVAAEPAEDLVIPPRPPLPSASDDLELDAEEPEAVEPEVVEPEVVEPEAVEPEVVEPEAVEPEVVEPEVIEPEVVEPEVIDPEVVEPEVIEPTEVQHPDPFAASVVLDDAVPDAEQAVLVVRGVTKTFGDTRAVDAIDLTVPAGTFYGIVGPNGAGKTTSLSLIAGLLRPDKGSIRVNGLDVTSRSADAKRLMGVLPDRLRTFDRLTGRQLLYYYGVLRGLSGAVVESRIADLARAFDLTPSLGRAVSDYSAGMVKKVMLAGALIHSPRLLVLDEPFESVDPVSSAIILDILSAYVSHGGTVILSSHGMEFVERVCSRVAVIVAGQVLAEGTVAEVRGELTLEQRFVELAGGLSDVEGLEWLHTFSD